MIVTVTDNPSKTGVNIEVTVNPHQNRNSEIMTDESTPLPADNLPKPRGRPFKKGFDPNRWMQGRPRLPKDKAAANKLVEHLIWDVLSETIVNPANGQEIDRLRAMIRSMTTNKNMQDKILDRILGKVQQPLDLTSGGEKIGIGVDDTRREILGKLDSIAAATGANAISKQPE